MVQPASTPLASASHAPAATSAALRASQARVVVLQDGGRLHYAIPAALHRQQILERVFCDWYSRPWSGARAIGRLLRLAGRPAGQRLLDRYSADLRGADVQTHATLAWRTDRLRKKALPGEAIFEASARDAADWVRRVGVGGGNAFFGFIRSVHPELLRWAKRQGVGGLTTIGDQIIAPYAVERAEEALQRERFPDFSPGAQRENRRAGEDFWIDVERDTWAALDHITCASAYVRDGLVAQGVAAERITVNPYPVPLDHFPMMERRRRDGSGPITVGFVGAVNLRKGTPYLWQVAERFDPSEVRFVMIGPVGVSEEAIARHRGHVELAGAVARSEIPGRLAACDIYFFPSTCEGSAGAALEAMATGLPVVTSPNSGSVVEHGKSGFVYPYDAIDAYEDAIRRLASDGELRRSMGEAARARVEALGLEQFCRTMVEMLG